MKTAKGRSDEVDSISHVTPMVTQGTIGKSKGQNFHQIGSEGFAFL